MAAPLQDMSSTIMFEDDSDGSAVSTPPQSPIQPASLLEPVHTKPLPKPRKRKEPDPNAPPKPPRKRKDPNAAPAKNPDGSDKPPKEKKPRKPRDPNAPPMKRQKKNDGAPKPIVINLSSNPHSSAPQQGMMTQNNNNSTPHSNFAQIGKSETEKKPADTQYGVVPQNSPPQYPPQPVSAQQPARPRYDPIRSASAENAANPEFIKYTSPAHRVAATPPAHARASPSIASLIDPQPDAYTGPRPYNPAPVRPLQQYSPPGLHAAPGLSSPSINSSYAMPPPARPEVSRPVSNPADAAPKSHSLPVEQVSKSNETAKPKALRTNRVDSPPVDSPPKPSRPAKISPAPIPAAPEKPSNLTTPKLPPPKKERPPVEPLPNDCIVIEVPMTGPTGNYCNFMKEVETKYGFDVAYPRLAQHKKRMAHMASLGAALEGATLNSSTHSGEDADMIPPPTDDSGAEDSNIEMGGLDEDSTAAEGAKKKRRTKADEYDKTDDFIDDAEQAWEEQALASKDGYFVWMGPLITEEEKNAAAEKAGAGKGRARGKSGAGREVTKAGARTGSGVVPRTTKGTSAANGTRKPRATKEEMAQRKAEKAARDAAKEAAKEAKVKDGTAMTGTPVPVAK
jgi:hypothetical protein